MRIIGRKFAHDEFAQYLDGLNVGSWAKFVVVHNTSSPDVATYMKWVQRGSPSPEQWLKNLVSYYAGLDWKGTPHLFIPPVPDQILVLNDLRVHGTHTPSWNAFSIGVETVGEFERDQFDGTPSHDNLVFALAQLHRKFNFNPADFHLGVSGLHFHKEDKNTTHKTCPGRHIVKASLVSDVMKAMGGGIPGDHTHDVPIASQEADTDEMTTSELTSVKWLQLKLNSWHPSLKLAVDGVNGPKTKDAVRQYQKAFNLTVDGIAGPVTRLSLKTTTEGN